MRKWKPREYSPPVPVRDPGAIPTEELEVGQKYRVRIQRCPRGVPIEATLIFQGVRAVYVEPVDCGEDENGIHWIMRDDGLPRPEWEWPMAAPASIIGGAFLAEALIVAEEP